ncbi:MAG: GTP-binding protein, partial [Candidatus Eremiobacteraeota bacterium]|nr:GTP-binding protein [Candidatus Eremiobacteraeota bacterium]
MNALLKKPLEERPHYRALRFLMAGSVDDGKSTLTGRLLYETQAILGDQLGKLQKKAGSQPMDLSLLTDGLEAEREQGITIDVAYRYFSTPSRKFIIADAPGHEQYTRNMVTAAAGSDAAVILVDITKLDLNARPVALLAQTRRHTLLAHLLRVPSIVFAINKIDAVDDPKAAFEVVSDALLEFTKAAGIAVAGVLPISALRGDNVTTSAGAEWYGGPTLLQFLEELPAGDDEIPGDLLLPVQYVSRDPIVSGSTQTAANSARVIWGRIARGGIKVGDAIQVFPSNERAVVVEVRLAGETVTEAEFGQSAGVVLDRHVDVARGNWLSTPHSVQSTQRFSASLAWMDTEPAQLGRKYLIRHGSRWVQGRIVGIESCLDIHTLEPMSAHALAVNEIGQVTIETQEALPLEPFIDNR